jgi:hypothetical protein
MFGFYDDIEALHSSMVRSHARPQGTILNTTPRESWGNPPDKFPRYHRLKDYS